MNFENPFFKRAAEHSTEVGEFLDLFASKCLDRLSEKNEFLFNMHFLFEGTPGGGKTTLLKLFTPEPLRQIGLTQKESSRYHIRQKLTELGALNTDGSPAILGIYLSCVTGYETISYNSVSIEGFYRLIDLRILMKAIRGALHLFGGNFPRDLKKLRIDYKEEIGNRTLEILSHLIGTCDEVYKFLSKEESSFVNALTNHKLGQLSGHYTVVSLEILRNAKWFYEDSEQIFKPVLFLDEVHCLSRKYWEALRNLIPARNLNIPIWYGIRSQVLSLDELFIGETWNGTINERDCVRIRLDSNRKKSRDTDNFLLEVAERRIKRAPSEILNKGTSLDKFLLNDYKKKYDYSKICEELAFKCNEYIYANNKFDSIKEYIPYSIANYDKAIYLYKLSIWMEREKNKSQPELFAMDNDKGLSDFLIKSEITNAAELFLSHDYNIPYYFGEDMILDLSSGNVQQFLNVSGKLFNRIMSNVRIKRPHNLTPEDQDEIIRSTAKDFWNDIPRYVPKGEVVQRFLKIIGSYCQQQTFRPAASYAPGITGIAMSISDYESLLKEPININSPIAKLAEIIRVCLAYNLFESGRDCIIRCKGRDWLVLYLNRLLCVYFSLPLSYGGFREQTRKTFFDWLEGVPSNLAQQENLF